MTVSQLPSGLLVAGQLPAALVGGRLDVNIGATGVTQPVSGTVTANAGTGTLAVSAASLPLPATAATDRATAGAPGSVELSDGAAFYTAAKTGQLPAALDGSGFVKVHEQGTATVAGTVTANAGTGTMTVDTELPAAAALSDATANPTSPMVGSGGMLWDATVWRRAASTAGTGRQIIDVNSMPTTAVTGTFWQATQPVSGTFWQATQPVSGTVTANAGTGPWPVTDNAGSLTVDAPVATPVASRLSDGAAFYDATKTGQLPAALVSSRLDVNLGAAPAVVTEKSDQPAITTGTITTAASTVTAAATNYSMAAITVLGTYAGVTVNFEVSDGGVTFYSQAALRQDGFWGPTFVLGTDTSNLWYMPLRGVTHVRVRASAYTSGTANVRISPTASAMEPSPGIATSIAPADGLANPTFLTDSLARQVWFNGTTWDRAYNNWKTTTGDTGSKTVTFAGATQTNYNARGAAITILLGTVSGTTPTLAAQLQWSPDGGTTWLSYGAVLANLTATNQTGAILVYPTGLGNLTGASPQVTNGLTLGTTVNITTNAPLPRTWRINYTIAGTTPNFAITSVQVQYML